MVVALSLVVGVPASLLCLVPGSELSNVCQVFALWPSIRCKLNFCDHKERGICEGTLQQHCRTMARRASWSELLWRWRLQATLSSPSMLWPLVARAIAAVSWVCFFTALFGHIVIRLIFMVLQCVYLTCIHGGLTYIVMAFTWDGDGIAHNGHPLGETALDGETAAGGSVAHDRHPTGETALRDGVAHSRHPTGETIIGDGIAHGRHPYGETARGDGIAHGRHPTWETAHGDGIARGRHLTWETALRDGIAHGRHWWLWMGASFAQNLGLQHIIPQIVVSFPIGMFV